MIRRFDAFGPDSCFRLLIRRVIEEASPVAVQLGECPTTVNIVALSSRCAATENDRITDGRSAKAGRLSTPVFALCTLQR